jgi:dihydroxy-acid dehydratase
MSSSFEALGMSLLGSSQMASPMRRRPTRRRVGARAGAGDQQRPEAARHHHAGSRSRTRSASSWPRRLDQRRAALPRHRVRCGSAWTIDDFEQHPQEGPGAVRLEASGKYVAVDFHRAGGVPQVLKMLLKAGVLHGDCMTITGRTIAQELESVPDARAPIRT